jgi:hypothetical protein
VLAQPQQLYEGKQRMTIEPRTQSVAHQISSWQQIQRSERFLLEMRALDTFLKTMAFAGRELPVTVRPETMEHIMMLLTAELVRLRSAPT